MRPVQLLAVLAVLGAATTASAAAAAVGGQLVQPPPLGPPPPPHRMAQNAGNSTSGDDPGPPPEPPQCKLLGGAFADLVQLSLAAFGLGGLLIKRTKESPRRPWKIWSMDVGKQCIGRCVAWAPAVSEKGMD